SLNRRVALKVLPFASTLAARQLQRFKHEAQAAAHLHHPNIVPVHATGCERGVHYYAMQFIDGQNLAAVIHGLRQEAGLDRGDAAADAGRGAAAVPSCGRPAEGSGAEADPERTTVCTAAPAAAPAADTSPQAARAPSTARSTRSPAFFRAVAHLGVQAAEALE